MSNCPARASVSHFIGVIGTGSWFDLLLAPRPAFCRWGAGANRWRCSGHGTCTQASCGRRVGRVTLRALCLSLLVRLASAWAQGDSACDRTARR